MLNFTEEQKQILADAAATGAKISFVSYNPTTTVGDPELAATSAGFVEYYRETSATLVEIIYTNPALT